MPAKLLSTIIILIGYLLTSEGSFAQGLKFHGGEQSIDNRTSYNVFENTAPSFSDRLDIEFDLALYPETQIGYIIRIKNSDDKKIYNLFYDGQGSNIIFKFNKEGHNSLITAEIDRQQMSDANWSRMKISLDLANDSVKLTILDRTFAAAGGGLPKKYSPIIVFGKSDYVIDVPSFAIKNLTIGDTRKYTMPLDESDGCDVHDAKGKTIGSVSNPEWLINNSYHWRLETSFSSQSVAGCNYNPAKKEIYYFNRDSIHIYNVWSKECRIRNFENQCPIRLQLGTNFINTTNHKLYAYEVYDDINPGKPTMASLDLDKLRWTTQTNEQLTTQLHHHGAFFNDSTGRYTIFGGFGNMKYSNDIYTFDTEAQHWTKLSGLDGTIPFPRYFSSVGYLAENNSMYIFGGMGNGSGEQVVGREYFYDLHKIDLNTLKSTKIWEAQPQQTNMVPVRGMIILDDTSFYTLCYPESFSDSFLRLYRFSLKDGSYEILGDSIPIHSDKITTNANLYYDPQINNLYVTVQEFDDDIASELKVYSLAFPPITAAQLASFSNHDKFSIGFLLLTLLCAAGAVSSAYLLFKKSGPNDKQRAHAVQPTPKNQDNTFTPKANSVYLFGDFMVFDRHGKEITYMFSSRLKQTLCLILQYSNGDGITSQRLSNLLWPDKPGSQAKNSRSVTINHLRKTLSELDGTELIHEKGCFKIVQTEAFYCDYIRCRQILDSTLDKQSSKELTQIIARGKFLNFSNEALFDSFKERLEHTLEPVLQMEMAKSFASEDYPTTISLAQAEFNIDPLNDEALAFLIKSLNKLKMTEEARIKYQSFVVQYKTTIGSDYPHPLKSF